MDADFLSLQDHRAAMTGRGWAERVLSGQSVNFAEAGIPRRLCKHVKRGIAIAPERVPVQSETERTMIMREFVCRVTADDRIVFVDANWLAFARENDMPRLTVSSVTGTSLWNHVSEPTTQEFYRIIMGKVRATGRKAVVPFRCDGPECRRFMEMAIVSLGAGALEFRCVLLREEARPRVDLLDREFPRTAKWLRMCAWCKKVEAGEWVEAEEAVRRLALFDQPRLPQITHGVCPECQGVFASMI